jgi:hypothetical protein
VLKIDSEIQRCNSLSIAEQELLILDVSRIKAGKEHGAETVNGASLAVEHVNRIRPEQGNNLDNRVRAVDDSSVGSVIDGELEGPGLPNRLMGQFRILVRLKPPLLVEFFRTSKQTDAESSQTSMRYRKAFNSLKRKELPTEIV